MFSKIKYLTFSIILILFSSFFFLNKVKAEELNTVSFNYENYTTYYQQASTYIEEVFNYLKNYENDYYYFISFKENNISVYVIEKNQNVSSSIKLSSSSYSFIITKNGNYIRSLSLSTSLSSFNTNFTNFKTKLENNQLDNNTSGFSSSSAYGNSNYYRLHTILYYTNFDNFVFLTSNTNALDLNGLIIQPGEKIPTYYDVLEQARNVLKKESSYSYLNDGANSLKYIDLYFNSEDFNTNINYKLEYYNFNNFDTCGFNCEKTKISSFDVAYLINDNGLYKWVKNNDIGVFIDHNAQDISTIYNDNGFVLDGIINLNFDNVLYNNVVQIKISIGLSSAFNYTWRYYDNSNINDLNIDEYFSSMLGKNGNRLYRNVLYEKYAVFSTNQEKINIDLLNEYFSMSSDKNTNYLYVRYYDTYQKSYIEDDRIITTNNFFTHGRDMEKYNFDIGTVDKKSFYIMNYLYHKLDTNDSKFYYFYIPLELSYSKTDYLDTAIYIDSNNVVSNGIMQNPKDESDNILFSDNFRKFSILITELEETRLFCNSAFNTIYMQLPLLIRILFEFAFNVLCIKVLFEMLGYGDY